MQTNLESENTVLKARNQWLTNVNMNMTVMIRNAADVLEEYSKQLQTIQDALKETQAIYSRLYKDLQVAQDEKENKTNNELRKTIPGTTPEEW